LLEPPVWGKQTIQKTPTEASRNLGLLPEIEPGPKCGLVQKARFFGYSTDPERGCRGGWIWQVGFG
jgi:hypothetical protein